MLILPGADKVVHTNAPAAQTQGDGENTTPTLAPLTGKQTARQTETSTTEVASKIDEIWFTMQDPHGIDILICRPGFTTFAMQTHAYRWSFVSDCAGELNPTEACIDHNKWHCTFAPCANEVLPAQQMQTTSIHNNVLMITTSAMAHCK